MNPSFSSSPLAARLQSKIVTNALGDPLFRELLDEASSEITNQARRAINEATIEGVFDSVIYSTLKTIGISFHPEKEASVNTKRHVGRGRTDSRLGALVIEYKHRSKLSSAKDVESGQEQIESYLETISEQVEGRAIGFVTDGIHFYEISSDNGKIESRSGRQNLNGSNLLRLTKSILSLEQSALTATNLVRDFCGTHFDGIIFGVARTLFGVIRESGTDKTIMLFSEWEALFRLAHEDQSQQKRIQERRKILGEIFQTDILNAETEYYSLFSLHTAYAILLKIIAYRIVSDIRFGSALQNYKSLLEADSDNIRTFCSSLEDGDLFRKIGILNLLEGDFFSWYSDSNQWNNELADSIKNILQILARYEDARNIFESEFAVDLFRNLYEATVPQVIRASFGEFYTPYWLASHVLNNSNLSPSWTALDPCCGSGTFVIAAISKIREELKEQDNREVYNAIINRVAAIDLNPLAVLTTRIHFFIHIAELIPEDISDLVIPVYLGDASYVPSITYRDGVQFLNYELTTLKAPVPVELPRDLATDTASFIKAMLEFELLVKQQDVEAATELLLEIVPHLKNHTATVDAIRSLSTRLIDLEARGWNGIWARIIANFLTTACLSPVTNIIGNPPWIDWKNLPAGYRERVKSLCIDKGLFSGAGRTGGINLNICALITHVSATNWLKNEGHLAFLMPRELANQASYEGWRRSVGGTGCHLIAFHDWSNAGHPFDPVKEDFMTFIIRKSDQKNQIIPTTTYKKKRGRSLPAASWASLSEALEQLEVTQAVAGQIIEGSSIYTIADSKETLEKFSKVAGHCSYIGREGIEFYPQEMQLFEYVGPGQRKGTVFVKNVQNTKSKYKVSSQKTLLETKYLFPLVKGRYIELFHYDDTNLLVAFPYHESDPHRPINQKALKSESPLLLAHYQKFQQLIKEQTKYSDSIRAEGEFYGLARTGPYSFAHIYVAFRDNTKWVACVIKDKEMPWGERKRFLFQNHAVSICERQGRKGFITEQEAYFVAGILNTPVVGEFINSSSDNRSFKIRPPIYIPPYDENNDLHQLIAVESRNISISDINKDESIKIIENAYLRICDSNPHKVSGLNDYTI